MNAELFRTQIQPGLEVSASDGYGQIVSIHFHDDMGLTLEKAMDPAIARELGVALMDAATKADAAAKLKQNAPEGLA